MAARTVKTALIGDAKSLNKAFRQSETRAGKWQSSMSRMSAGVGQAMKKAMKIGVLGLAGAGAASIALGADFDKSMAKITGLVGIPKEEVDKLRDSVLDLAGETAKSPKELADALFSVTSAGFDGAEALEVLDLSAKAAAAGLGSTEQVALTLGSAINAYGKENLTAAQAADILVGTVKAGNLSAEELSGALGKILPIASAAGVGLDEVGASVALITRSGSTASEAVTQMKAAIQSMNAPNESAAKSLQAMGLSVGDLQDTLANDGLLAALQMVETATDGDAVAMKKFFGSSEALSGALTILNGDADTVIGVFDDLANASGLTDEAFESAAGTPAFKMSKALNSLKVLGVKLSGVLLPLAALAGEKLAGALEGVGDIIDTKVVPAFEVAQAAVVAFQTGGLDGLQRFISEKFGPSSVVARVFRGVREFVTGTLNGGRRAITDLASAFGTSEGTILKVIGGITAALAGLALAWTLGPGMIVVGVVALVAGLLYAYENVEWFREGVQTSFKAIGDAVTWIKKLWDDNFDSIRNTVMTAVEVIETLWARFGDNILRVAKIAFGFVSDTVKAAMKVIQGIIKTITSIISGDWSGAWDGIKQTFAGVWDAMAAYIRLTKKAIVEAVRAVIDGVKLLWNWDWLSDKANAAVSAVVDAFKAIPGLLGALGGSILQAGKDLAGSLIDGLVSAVSNIAGAAGDFGKAFANAVVKFMNANVIDKLNRAVEFKIGLPFGRSFNVNPRDIPRIPSFHTGGTYSAPMGQAEGLALLSDGEEIRTKDQQTQGNVTNIYITVQGESVPDFLQAFNTAALLGG